MRLTRSVHKYGAIKIKIDGITFPSLYESKVYIHLKQLQKLKLISRLTLQNKVIFFSDKVGKRKNEISTVIDFKYTDLNGYEIYCEAKGMDTPVWNLKKKLWIHFINKPLVIYHGMSKNTPKISETLCGDKT